LKWNPKAIQMRRGTIRPVPTAAESLIWICAIPVAYIAGSIPFGILLGRAKGVDIRAHGSRNVGATNVSRVLGRRLGLICFALDALKGAIPVLAAGAIAGVVNQPLEEISQVELWLWLAVAGAAILGHIFSVFIRFAGGKGVATGFGAMLGMWPLLTIPALAALMLWIITAAIWRYVSLASMVAAAALPVSTSLWLMYLAGGAGPQFRDALETTWPLPATAALLALLVIWRHRGNILRLRRGQEPRIGDARP